MSEQEKYNEKLKKVIEEIGEIFGDGYTLEGNFVKEPFVQFASDHATISFQHDHIATQQDVDSKIRYTYVQSRIHSGEKISEVPIEELRRSIRVRLHVGDIIPSQTMFTVKKGQELYIGLGMLHQENPTIIPRVIDDLKAYKLLKQLDEQQGGLVDYAIQGLQNILNPTPEV